MSAPVPPIPPHYAAAMPYVIVPDGASAIAFYARVFGAIELYRLTGPGGSVVHAELRIGAALFMLASGAPEHGTYPAAHYGGSPVSIVVHVEDVDAFFAGAAAECTVIRPPTDEFYGDRATVLRDPFGLRWTFATHIEDVTHTEMQARLDRMFSAQS